MSRRILLAAVTAATVAVGLAGCGIPNYTDVRVDGGGPAPGAGSDDGLGKQPPGRADSGENLPQFALNFLLAAAGETSGAYERVRKYIAKDSQWEPEKPGQEVAINVVRLAEPPSITNNADGNSSVTVSVQQVGVLRANGALEPPVEKESEYTFVVGKRGSVDVRPSRENSGFYVIEPPKVLLMSTDALEDFYLQRTIYFWSRDGGSLVPDLRYLPVAVPRAGQATEMLGWLVGGPAGWLQATAIGLPAGTKTVGNVFPQSGGRLVVNLSVDSVLADKDSELERLATQLVWSLRETALGNELELTIKDQGSRVFDAGAQRQAHPAYRIERSPQRFCVCAGAVRRLLNAGEVPSDPAPIASEANRNIVSAAFSRDSGPLSAALVTTAGNGRRLLVGSGVGTIGKFVRGGRTFPDMSRPVWLKTPGSPGSPDPVGLVVADNRLYRFGLNAVLTGVDLPGAVGEVTAVGAGLDGNRIAFVAGGRLYVAALTVDGRSVEVGPARQLRSSLHDLTAVEWTDENMLVAAGAKANGRTALYAITVDGALETPSVDDLGTATVTHIAAYPYNPVRGGGGRPMYVANGVAFDGSPALRIDSDQVEGGPGSSASASGAKPAAPFFLY